MLRPTTTLPVVGVIAIPFLLLTVEAATESTGVESVGTTQAPSPRKNVVAPPPLGTYPTLFPPLYLFAITLNYLIPLQGERMFFLHTNAHLYKCQRYTYRVHQTIQMKLILLCVWAEPAILGSTKTALKFKYEI